MKKRSVYFLAVFSLALAGTSQAKTLQWSMVGAGLHCESEAQGATKQKLAINIPLEELYKLAGEPDADERKKINFDAVETISETDKADTTRKIVINEMFVKVYVTGAKADDIVQTYSAKDAKIHVLSNRSDSEAGGMTEAKALLQSDGFLKGQEVSGVCKIQ